MSILLYGVGPGSARLATNDLTHGLRHQAARRALGKHHCKTGVSLLHAAECADSMWRTRSALKEVSYLSFPGHGREGGC